MKMKIKGSRYTFVVDEELGRQCEELIREFNMFNIEEILYGHFCEIYECDEDVECNKECYECEDRCKDDYDKCIDKQRKCYAECETECGAVYQRRRYLEECIKDCKKKCDEKYNRRECEDRREKCLKACESVCECTEVIEVRVR